MSNPIMQTSLHNDETLTRKARTSISSFFHPPTLKRKRSCCSDQDDTIMEEPPLKKANKLTKFIRSIFPGTKKVSPPPRQSFKTAPVKVVEFDALWMFQNHFRLPPIEWTNGSLNIKEQVLLVEEEDSIFCQLEFPVPPPLSPKFNSLYSESDSEESLSLPETPASSINDTIVDRKTWCDPDIYVNF